MLCFDKIKIITNIKYINNIKKDYFINHYKSDNLIYCKYKQMIPYSLIIIIDYTKQSLILEFTSKILLENYTELINYKNIETCLSNINNLEICNLDIKSIILDSNILKCDVTKDIQIKNFPQIIQYIKENIINYKKWIYKEYKNGISIENVVSTARYKKRLTICNKQKELEKSTNIEYLRLLKNKEEIIAYFHNKIRFELNINTVEQIRKFLQISNNNLMSVLYSVANPFLSIINEAINCINIEENTSVMSLHEYERSILLKQCDYDLQKVEIIIRKYISKNTSINRAMQPYRELYQKLKATKTNTTDLKKLLI